jgi:catechol 2,3-dioxygenase-like lactoylglutathione lyase family enzyme
MPGRISTVTLNTPDLPAAVAAYQRYLGFRVLDDGALAREVARAWGRPQLAGQRAVLLEPASGAETFLRFVQGPAYVDYEPLACVGWNAVELIVQDVDALARQLAGSPFRVVGPPADLSFSDRIRAMQVVGPAREMLYLTEIKEKLAAFDTPLAASFVDRPFIVILGGTSLDALQDYYHSQFGVARAAVMPAVVSVLSAAYGLPRDHRHSIAALALPEQCYIEADEMPAAAAARPCVPGQLPPGVAVVSFEIDRPPDTWPSRLGPAHRSAGLPYAGRESAACVGAAGELIELIASGARSTGDTMSGIAPAGGRGG